MILCVHKHSVAIFFFFFSPLHNVHQVGRLRWGEKHCLTTKPLPLPEPQQGKQQMPLLLKWQLTLVLYQPSWGRRGWGRGWMKTKKGNKNAAYNRSLGFLSLQRTRYLPHSCCSQRFLQDRSTSIFTHGDGHIHLLCLKRFLAAIFKYPLHYHCYIWANNPQWIMYPMNPSLLIVEYSRADGNSRQVFSHFFFLCSVDGALL